MNTSGPVHTNEKGHLSIRGKQKIDTTLELITATGNEMTENSYNPLKNEIRTWSLDPDFLIRALRRTIAPKSNKASFNKKLKARPVRASREPARVTGRLAVA